METKVAVGGWHVQNREHVRTAPIANRLDIHNVVTEDGVEVFLGGAMDQETSSANGFPPGIVQCLSAGFPYMWKQLLRVKSVGEVPPSFAVSERLGGLHSEGSKCLSEDENQDVNDLKFFKNVGEAASSWSRGCGDAINADSLVTPVKYVPDAVGAEAAVIAGGQTSHVADTEAMLPIRAETSEAVDECHPRDVLVQQSCDVNSSTLGCALVAEIPLEHAIETFPTKKAETDPIVKTNSLTTRSSRKSKKELSLPVRSSRRLQQRQLRSSGFTTCRIDPLASDQIEEVASGISIAEEMPSEVEPGEILPDKEQAITECNKLSNSYKVNVLQQDQDPVESLDDLQCKEVVVSDQTEDHHECLLKGGLASRTLHGEVVIEDVLAGVKIEATVPVATRNLENEDIEKSIPVADPNFVLEQEVAVGVFDSEREDIDESAPATPSELLQSKIQSRVEFLSKASSLRTSELRVLSEIGTRVTRSLKRRLRMSPTTDTEALPLIRSMRRSGRISKANTVCVSNFHQDDVADLEVMLDPDPPPQEEVDVIHARVRGLNGSSAKAVKCSNCYQPCSPPVARRRNCNVVRSEVSYEQAVPKEERMDYAPLSPFQHTQEVHELRNYDRTDTYLTEPPSGQFKAMEPATRFAETGTSRRMTVGVASEGPSKGKILSNGKGSSEGSSHSKRSSYGNGSDQGKESNRSEEVFMQGKGSCCKDDSGEFQGRSESIVHSEVKGISEGLGLVLSRVKNRRKSIIPPPLPPPRVRDKSRVPEAFGLKTSRSGRLLVPPLAYWRSQSIEYDKDGGIIAIFDGFQAKPADTGCFNFTPPQAKHVKRIQEKLCKAATSITKRK
jgi:hypothetical protein